MNEASDLENEIYRLLDEGLDIEDAFEIMFEKYSDNLEAFAILECLKDEL